jgi:stearoyl-CoA desaturase (Delta-9 desaturase)
LSWKFEVALAAVWYGAVALGVTIGYHRVLTHRAAKLSRPLLLLLVWAGLPAGPPAEWVGNHRAHHRHGDGPGDPHCPRRAGFWFAHAGWYLGIQSPLLAAAYACCGPLRLLIDAVFRPVIPAGYTLQARDVLRDPLLSFMSTRTGYALCAAPHLLPVGAACFLHGWLGLAVSWLLAVVMYNAGDLVNSALHLAGRRHFATGDDSRDSGWLALPTLGESYHNGHHAFPGSARHGLLPGQVDLAYAFLRVLAWLGLARRVRLPSAAAIAAKRLVEQAAPASATSSVGVRLS